MLRIFSDCEVLTVVEAEDKTVEVKKTFELFSKKVKTEQSDNFSLIKREFEKLVNNQGRNQNPDEQLPDLSCAICKKSFPTKPKLKKHTDSHKYQKPDCYQCSKCSKKFSQISKFNLHSAVHIKNEKISCTSTKCEMRFELKNQKYKVQTIRFASVVENGIFYTIF